MANPYAKGATPKKYTAFGESKSIREWSLDARCVCLEKTLRYRFGVLGWPLERALHQVVRGKRKKPRFVKPNGCVVSAWGITKNLSSWVEEKYVTVSIPTLWRRIKVKQWPPEQALMLGPRETLKDVKYTSPWDMTLGQYLLTGLRKHGRYIK